MAPSRDLLDTVTEEEWIDVDYAPIVRNRPFIADADKEYIHIDTVKSAEAAREKYLSKLQRNDSNHIKATNAAALKASLAAPKPSLEVKQAGAAPDEIIEGLQNEIVSLEKQREHDLSAVRQEAGSQLRTLQARYELLAKQFQHVTQEKSGGPHSCRPDPSHPPYEQQIDLRIPLHFVSGFPRRVGDAAFAGQEKSIMDFHQQCHKLFKSLGLEWFVICGHAAVLSPDESQCPRETLGPAYFAVLIRPEDYRTKAWTRIHQDLRRLVQQHFLHVPCFADPPIRYQINRYATIADVAKAMAKERQAAGYE